MNIYITRENRERLEKEDSMSGLVNRLLREHYDALRSPGISVKVEPTIKEMNEVAKETTKGLCKQHQVDKSVCRYMKHD